MIFEFIDHVLDNKNNLKYMTQGAFIGLLIFILYLELNPKLGNIWYRHASSGNKELQPDSLMHFLSYPFKSTLFWEPVNWDMNVIVMSGFAGTIYTLARNIMEFL